MIMRFREFVGEGLVKNSLKPRPDAEMAMPAAHRVAGTADRTYDLNRIMMAAAMADGKSTPKMPVQSWAGKNNIAAPYTKLESDMLKHAYQATNAEWDDALKPNPQEQSLEDTSINTQSPVPKKRYNRHGI